MTFEKAHSAPLPLQNSSESSFSSDNPEEMPAADQKSQISLTLVATPIGNFEDMPPRAVKILKQVSIILAEDTRNTRKLLQRFQIKTGLESLHEHNEKEKTKSLIARMKKGESFALVSDAGMPLLSDPGYYLVREVMQASLKVSAVPGPNAALTALVLSGLPPYPFLFQGFMPAGQTARQKALKKLCDWEKAGFSATVIWYEAPHRLAESLSDCALFFGQRPMALVREISKLYEEVRQGTAAELAAYYQTAEVRGECVLLLGKSTAEDQAQAEGPEAAEEMLKEALKTKSLSSAVKEVALISGLSKNELYAAALRLKEVQEKAESVKKEEQNGGHS